jgi:predicted phosphodiesterase
MYLRILGDVHGKIDEYISLASQAEYSIQLGDLGFSYEKLKSLDSTKHRCIGGNHDNYEFLDGRFFYQTPHFLGDYGTHSVSGITDIFFLRGGYSIDRNQRTEGVDWWPKEQISYADGTKALEEYIKAKPKIMLSHECPAFIVDMIAGFKTWDGKPIRPSMTAYLLEQMFEEHKPAIHIFGHHHKFFNMIIEGTQFICLPELDYLDISCDGSFSIIFNKKT